MAVTIKELSKACGLSVSTVSKALNDYPDVSEETREQVRAIAARMGYRPSAIARGLKIGRTFNLGVWRIIIFLLFLNPSRRKPSAAGTILPSSPTAQAPE